MSARSSAAAGRRPGRRNQDECMEARAAPVSAGAALRTTAEERLRAGRAQPAPGAARALRVVSILGLLRWLVVEGVSSSARR